MTDATLFDDLADGVGAAEVVGAAEMVGAADSSPTRAPTPPSAVPHPGQWRLDRIEVVNWGTFQGHHVINVARQGFLLTGHSGSGKSSLVDAVAAVLTPRGKLRFNAAAADTSTRREDRTTASYVRGAWRRHADATTGEVVSDYLRPGATWSGILLRYSDGTTAEPITLVKLFHLNRGAAKAGDATELHIVTQEPVGLLDLQDYARNGIETRRIKARWPAATVTNTHSVFSARFTRLLGISGENALLLLHKTQSAKSLGSLDDLFRTFMLDEPRTYAQAETAIVQFGDLAAAHALVIEARKQVEHLRTLVPHGDDYHRHSSVAEHALELRAALGPFKDTWKHSLAIRERSAAEAALRTAENDLDLATTRAQEAASALGLAKAQVDARGGAAITTQELWVTFHEAAAHEVRTRRLQVAAELAAVGVVFPESFAEFEELQATARRDRDALAEAHAHERGNLLTAHEKRSEIAGQLRAVRDDLAALKGQRSNLDRGLLEARDLICRESGIPASALPFAGELLQVRAEFATWTGAIERVLRPLSTLMLVPAAHLDAVSQAVEATFLGSRLVFEAIPVRVDAPRSVRGDRSLATRVDVKPGAMAEWLNWTLSRLYDYECVDDPRELRSHDQAVTIAGQVKRGVSRFEKDDRAAITDRRRWVLGFDNTDKVEHLLALQREATAELATADGALERADTAREQARQRMNVLATLATREWKDLDVAAAEETVRRHKLNLDTLLAGNRDLRVAQQQEREAAGVEQEARQEMSRMLEVRAGARSLLANLAAVVAELEEVVAGYGPIRFQGELEERFQRVRRSITGAVIDAVTVTVLNTLDTEKDAALRSAGVAERAYASIAVEFHRRWPAIVGDLAAEVADHAGYLDVLGRLAADRLPDFEEKFFDLLESQSRRNVGQLAVEIRRAQSQIEERIAPVNRSLNRSNFDTGRYLQIRVDDNRSAAAKEFLTDLQTISSDTWNGQDRSVAEARFAVMDRLMKRLTSSESGDRSWRELCLDTRGHVRFTGVEMDANRVTLNIHDSAAGLSGGQRQKLVIFCLAAALRYQLATDDADVPSFGTIILDEAFDKADSAFTQMAMDIFLEFGFHMILATPLKLLQTLEEYVGAIGLADCQDFRNSTIAVVTLTDDTLAGAVARDAGSDPTGRG